MQESSKEINNRFDGLESNVKEIKTMVGELDPQNTIDI